MSARLDARTPPRIAIGHKLRDFPINSDLKLGFQRELIGPTPRIHKSALIAVSIRNTSRDRDARLALNRPLPRSPMRVRGKEPVDKANLVSKEQTKTKT
jgi:hypothetical protein